MPFKFAQAGENSLEMPFKFAQAGGNKGLRCPLSLHQLVETKA